MLINKAKVKRDYLKAKEKKIKNNNITMSELNFQNMFLLSLLVKQYKSKAWKSKLHSDGNMYPDMFIVGINNVAFYYDLKYWDYFKCKVVTNAPEEIKTSEDIGLLLDLK